MGPKGFKFWTISNILGGNSWPKFAHIEDPGGRFLVKFGLNIGWMVVVYLPSDGWVVVEFGIGCWLK